MIRGCSRRPLVGLVVLACLAGLTACGGGGSANPSESGSRDHVAPAGAIDTSICQVITKATTAYTERTTPRGARTWPRSRARPTQRSTPRSRSTQRRSAGVQESVDDHYEAEGYAPFKVEGVRRRVDVGVLLASLGGFVGLQHVCANLPSPGSTSSGQGAPATTGEPGTALMDIRRLRRAGPTARSPSGSDRDQMMVP